MRPWCFQFAIVQELFVIFATETGLLFPPFLQFLSFLFAEVIWETETWRGLYVIAHWSFYFQFKFDSFKDRLAWITAYCLEFH